MSDDDSSRERESVSSSSSSSSSNQDWLTEKSNLSETYSHYSLVSILRENFPRVFIKNEQWKIDFEYLLKSNLDIIFLIDQHVAYKCQDLVEEKLISYRRVKKLSFELYKKGFLDVIQVPTNLKPCEIYFIPGHPLSKERILRIRKYLDGYSEVKYDPKYLDQLKTKQKKIWKAQKEAAIELKQEFAEKNIQELVYCDRHPHVLKKNCHDYMCQVINRRNQIVKS